MYINSLVVDLYLVGLLATSTNPWLYKCTAWVNIEFDTHTPEVRSYKDCIILYTRTRRPIYCCQPIICYANNLAESYNVQNKHQACI